MFLRLVHPALPAPDAAGPDPEGMPWPHPTPIVSVACAPDGAAIATGSPAPLGRRDAEAPVVGVTIWDVGRARPRVVVPVEGGVCRARPSGRGLRFSSDGRLLGFNHLTNAVGVLDATSGRVRASALASAREAAPSFALSPAGDRLVVGAADDTPDAWATTFSIASGGPLTRLPARAGERSLEVLSWHDGLVHALGSRALLALDPAGGAVVAETPLDEDVGGERVWLSPDGGEVVIAGRERLSRLETARGRARRDLPLSLARGAVFCRDERRLGVLRGAAGAEEVLALEGDAIGARIPGPFASGVTGGLPLALRPDGEQIAVLRPGGGLEIASTAGSYTRSRLATVPGASAVLWPRHDVIALVGAAVVAFVRPTGELIAR